jgi:phosphoglycerol transferase MdoB-like AlkP superfamily enzyme
MNRYSALFHVFLACGICFIIEWVSRHSFLEACAFVKDRGLVFLYNSLIIYASLMLVYIFRRRAVSRVIISVFWLFLGIINGCVLAKRVTPFSFTDLKMVGDLFTMQSNYFSTQEAALVIVLVALVILSIVIFWFRGPKFAGCVHRISGLAAAAAVLLALPLVTKEAVSQNILTSYFENIAQGYWDYGFVYSFTSSVVDRGMSTPQNYSEEAVQAVLARTQKGIDALVQNEEKGSGAVLEKNETVRTTADADTEKATENAVETVIEPETVAAVENTVAADEDYPNIICVLLESFVDPTEVNFLELSEDPVPNFRYLYENYSSGYLEVPVVGAGTANTEFEILTGMCMKFFGLGEYPYKTILKKTNCESIASDLSRLGYGTHAVHNNGGNFYSRKNAFSMMGFDTFTSKELMDIQEYTPLGTWSTDHILIGEVEKALDYTPDQQDFVYTITVQGHGDYPQEKVIEDPEIQVSGAADEGSNYAWEYYVNEIHEVDKFIGDLIDMLSKRDEKTIVVMFGDHLPTMNLTEDDMATGSLFKTKYITWNNFGLEKKDTDLTSYQLMAEILEQIGIETGTMFQYHQARDTYVSEEEYLDGLELLQYDILYGEHYVYGGENPYPATDIIMGTEDVTITDVRVIRDYCYLYGENFTKWSKVYIGDTKVSTKYLSSGLLRISADKLSEGENLLTVRQLGSSNTVFRTSNEYIYEILPETESEFEYETESKT